MIIKFDNKKIKVKHEFNEENNYHTLTAISEKNSPMAVLTFKVDRNKNIWLYKIKVKDEYQRMGASTALIYAMENFAIKNKIRFIEGKFYPENAYAKPFYEKLGYQIYKEDYETYVGKSLWNIKEKFQIIEEDELTF